MPNQKRKAPKISVEEFINLNDPKTIGKAAAAQAAADLIQDGMLVGLGTGSTANFFIDSLIQRVQNGLKIMAVATSFRSLQRAQKGGIPILEIETLSEIDIAVDGADEIDYQKQMIKGGGGALLREKIVASMSKERVVIVDSSKLVDHLGRFPLPVELIPFAWRATVKKIEDAGYRGDLRKNKEGNPFVTDNGNWIYDIALSYPCLNPEKEDQILKNIPGILETGFFLRLAGPVVVGFPDEKVEIR